MSITKSVNIFLIVDFSSRQHTLTRKIGENRMLLSHVEKILNQEPERHFTITEVVDILILTIPEERNRSVLEAKIVNKIIKYKGRLNFSFGSKDGILYLYSRENDKYHRLNRKVPDTPFFNRLKKIKIRMTIFYVTLLVIGFIYIYFFK